MSPTLHKLAATCAVFCLSTSLYAGSAADSMTNQGGEDHALASAESDAAKVVELHTHLMEEGMMKMRRVDKIDLPAGETVKLEPGGLHIMLIGLERQLSPGEDVDITLVFEDGSRSSTKAPVKKVEVKMDHHNHH